MVKPGASLGQKEKSRRDTFPFGGNGNGGASLLDIGTQLVKLSDVGMYYPIIKGPCTLITGGFTGVHS